MKLMSLSLFIIMYHKLVNNCPPYVQGGEQCGLTPAVQEAEMLTSDYLYQPGSVPPPSGQLPLPTWISAPIVRSVISTNLDQGPHRQTVRSVTAQITASRNLNKACH